MSLRKSRLKVALQEISLYILEPACHVDDGQPDFARLPGDAANSAAGADSTETSVGQGILLTRALVADPGRARAHLEHGTTSMPKTASAIDPKAIFAQPSPAVRTNEDEVHVLIFDPRSSSRQILPWRSQYSGKSRQARGSCEDALPVALSLSR